MAHDRFGSFKLTPSMAVAVSALVLAASGGAYAATDGSARAHTAAKTKVVVIYHGPRGYRGYRGFRGYRGYRGYRGLRGFTGPRGLPGPKGATGTTGATGTAGATGAPGIPGSAGATGPSHIVTWSVNNVAVGTGGASGSGVVTLAMVGPFTILGKCTTNGSGTYYAQTYLRTTQAGSSENDFAKSSYPSFGPTTTDLATTQTGGTAVPGDVQIGFGSSGATAAFEGPNDGSTAAFSADGRTYINSFEGDGVLVGGATASAPCYFGGYVMSNAIA